MAMCFLCSVIRAEMNEISLFAYTYMNGERRFYNNDK